MHNVEVSKDGVGLGVVSFRGIATSEAAVKETRLFRCNPKQCVPKNIVQRIADRLAFGVIAGHEEGYEWHT